MLVVCDVAIYVDNYLVTNLKGAIEGIHVDMSFMIINITKKTLLTHIVNYVTNSEILSQDLNIILSYNKENF